MANKIYLRSILVDNSAERVVEKAQELAELIRNGATCKEVISKHCGLILACNSLNEDLVELKNECRKAVFDYDYVWDL